MKYSNELYNLDLYIRANPGLVDYQVHVDNALNMMDDWVNVVKALKGLYLEATEDGNFDVCDRVMDILLTLGE